MPANASNSSVPYPIPSLFASRKLYVGFSPKGLSDSDISISPTSTLETKHFSSKNHHEKVKVEVAPIGLALVVVLTNDASNHNRLYLFGSQLKIQLPSSPPPHPPPPQSQIEFGVKTKDSQLARQPMSLPPPADSSSPPEFLAGMELSEEYTCVISHGPNPKTTHIFDNCVVESCGGKLGFVALGEESGFLSCCHACKQNLSQGRDIFMYRGEKAFCSEECRRREIMLDDAEEKFTQDLSELL